MEIINLRLTKYEKTRILGIRATQISSGITPNIPLGNMKTPIEIAEEELRQKKINLIISRKLPNGKIYNIRVSDMISD